MNSVIYDGQLHSMISGFHQYILSTEYFGIALLTVVLTSVVIRSLLKDMKSPLFRRVQRENDLFNSQILNLERKRMQCVQTKYEGLS